MLHNPYLDPIASILIALLLIAVALLLGRETGALLTGERTNRARIKRISEIISADPAVESVGDLLTMQLGPDQALLTVAIKFRRGLNIDQLESTIAQLKTLSANTIPLSPKSSSNPIRSKRQLPVPLPTLSFGPEQDETESVGTSNPGDYQCPCGSDAPVRRS